MTLTGPDVVDVGDTYIWQVRAPELELGDVVVLGLGGRNQPGPCPYPHQLGGTLCLEIDRPLVVLGQAQVLPDPEVSAGLVASFVARVPATTRTEVHLQALSVTQSFAATSNVQTVQLCSPGLPSAHCTGDTDIEDTDVEDTDVEDTDVEDTDIADTDVPTVLEGYDAFVQDCAAHPGHMDPVLQGEHSALLDLVPLSNDPGVVEAVQDGSWFSASTWSSGTVPGDGDHVLIPCGREVWYDSESDARLHRVAVAGELHVDPTVDTRLLADTLLTTPTSILTVGVDQTPVAEDVRARIVIHRDHGPVELAGDPTLLTRGVITHGTVRITGHDKVDFLRTAQASAGDTSLVFTDEPVGWRIGDKLVVGATHNEILRSRQAEMANFEDEVVTIQEISESNGVFTVLLDQTLTYDHVPPSHASARVLRVPVANFTRNIFIGTETPDSDYLGNGLTVPTAERGHVMFMHNRDVSVKHAEFFELGRTDKALAFSAENVAGRYAMHFHRTGGAVGEPRALAEGNAVWGSPGWGIVQHDANLDVLSNAVFGVVGSGIVAEAGNEAGDWFDNIVIQTSGRVRSFNAQIQGGANVEQEAAYQAQEENNSFIQGEAYGMKSRLLRVRDNVAVSANGAGFSFWPHGTTGPSHIGSAAADFKAVQGYDPYFAQPDIYPGRVATRDFSGNEVVASRHALNTSANKKAHRTDVDILIEDLLAWNVDQAIMSFYQQNYIIKDSVFIRGTGNTQGFYYLGTDNNTFSSASHIHDPTEFKLVHNYFEGWDVVTKEPMEFIVGNTVVGSTITDETGPGGIFREGYTADNDSIELLDNSADWMSQLPNPAGTLVAQVDLTRSTLSMAAPYTFFSIWVSKTDSFGFDDLEMGAPRNKRFRFSLPADAWPAITAADGYYQQADGSIHMVMNLVVSDRLTGTAGMIPVAVELAFLQGDAAGLPAGAVNQGELPSEFVQGVAPFRLVDERRVGEVGNQLASGVIP